MNLACGDFHKEEQIHRFQFTTAPKLGRNFRIILIEHERHRGWFHNTNLAFVVSPTSNRAMLVFQRSANDASEPYEVDGSRVDVFNLSTLRR